MQWWVRFFLKTFFLKGTENDVKLLLIIMLPFRHGIILNTILYIDLRTGQTCHSKDGGSYISCCRGWAWLTIRDGVKIPRYSHKLTHRKGDLWTAWQLFPLDDDQNMPFQRRQKLHIPLAICGKRLSGRRTIV